MPTRLEAICQQLRELTDDELKAVEQVAHQYQVERRRAAKKRETLLNKVRTLDAAHPGANLGAPVSPAVPAASAPAADDFGPTDV